MSLVTDLAFFPAIFLSAGAFPQHLTAAGCGWNPFGFAAIPTFYPSASRFVFPGVNTGSALTASFASSFCYCLAEALFLQPFVLPIHQSYPNLNESRLWLLAVIIPLRWMWNRYKFDLAITNMGFKPIFRQHYTITKFQD